CLLSFTGNRLMAADAPGDRELFDRLDISKNGYLSGTEITPEVAKHDANGDGRLLFEEFVAGRARERGAVPAVTVAAPTAPAVPAVVPVKVAAVPASPVVPAPKASAVPSDKLPVLPTLKPKKGYITGRAVYADGRPVASFKAIALGWAGEIHLGPSGTLPSLGQVTGVNGAFEIQPTSAFDRKKVLDEAMVTVLRVEAFLAYNDRAYQIAMHPFDGKKDGSEETSFRGKTSKGVVRDFVLKLHGPKRGFETNTPPKDSYRNEPSDPGYNAFYGGTVSLDLDNRNGNAPEMAKLTGSMIQITFKPTGRLMDGSAAQTVIRTLPIQRESMSGYYFFFRDLPLGDYNAEVVLTKPDGASIPLRMKVLGGQWGTSAPVVFAPFNTIASVGTPQIFAIK
ncbi:MAG TPA: hypothetical protein VK968_10635, partial [Roseimicrobium sp.]|nr:hypothetical protein [Roseimicrobium sp.]